MGGNSERGGHYESGLLVVIGQLLIVALRVGGVGGWALR